MHGTGIPGVIVAAHEIVLQVICKNRDRIRVVLPPAYINFPGIVFSIVYFIRDGPVNKAVFCMIYSLVNRRWEDGLVVFVHMGGHIGPV